MSPVDASGEIALQFPLARDASPYVAELRAGDALFIPQGWWHEVVTSMDAVSLNMWWKPPLRETAWRSMLRAYAFALRDELSGE
jgi:hypothetical protein